MVEISPGNILSAATGKASVLAPGSVGNLA
jgi:hypothetical protein